MVKILHYPLTKRIGGIEAYATEHWRFMDKERFVCDFIAFNASFLIEPFFADTGSTVHYLSHRKLSLAVFAIEIEKILRAGNYDILHLHLKGWNQREVIVLETARRCGVGRIILHAHSTGGAPDQEKSHLKLRSMLQDGDDLVLCGCHLEAARWMFGALLDRHPPLILKNAIDTQRFLPRIQKKSSLSPLNIIACGYVEFNQYQQPFSLEIAKHLGDNKANLLFLGEGPDQPIVDRWCEQLPKLVTSNPSVWHFHQTLMSRCDCLLAPYLYGGMNRVVLEAQSCGIPCFVSDTLPPELDQTGLVHFLPLALKPGRWAEIIQKVCVSSPPDRSNLRTLDRSWDIREAVIRLGRIYEEGEDSL